MYYGLLLIRLVVGLTFAAHGSQKLFAWFGGGGISGTAAMMEPLGLRPGRAYAHAVGIAEFCGGLMFALGLLTPIAVAMLIAAQLVAVAAVHVRNGFFVQNGGYEYNLVLAAAVLGIVFTGPGGISMDDRLGIFWSGAPWALAALALGLLLGNVVLARRVAVQSTAGTSGS